MSDAASDAASDVVGRLESILAQLEVGPGELRRDPTGHTWLPAEARALVESRAECRAVLHDFVDDELALWGAMEPADPPSDPFFTARVVRALPSMRAGPVLDPRRRFLVLGLFHVVAGLLAYVVLTMVPESTARWAERAHHVLQWGSDSGVGMVVAAVAAGAVVLLALLGSRPHNTAA